MDFKMFLIDVRSGEENQTKQKNTIEVKWIGLEKWQLSHGLVASTREGLSTPPGDYPVPIVRV